MCAIFVHFRHLTYIANAIDIWSQGDRLIERIISNGAALQAAVEGSRDSARIDYIVAQLQSLNEQLRPIEDAFSYTLGQASRWATRLLTILMTILGGVMVAGAGLIYGRELSRTLTAEAALRESQDVLSLAMRCGRMGAWVRDLARNEVWRSRELEELFELPAGGFAGTEAEFFDFVHEEDRAQIAKAVDTAVAAGTDYAVEFRFRNGPGAWRWMDGRGRAIYDRDGRATRLFGIDIDITERKQAVEQFRLAIEAAPTGMLMIDCVGKIVLVNAQVEKLFGYSRKELLDQQIEMLVPERFRAHHPNFRKAFFRDPKTRAMGSGGELYGLRKDGTEMPVEIGLNPMQTPTGEFVVASIVDITERKRATEHFRLVLEAAPTGMLMMDEAGTIVLVNAQIEKLFGYPRAELHGRQIEMLVPDRFRMHHPGLRQGFFSAPRARLMGSGRDLYGLRKDGSEVPVEIGLNPLRTSAGMFVLSSIVDLSQRREMDRLRTDFVSTVSHELRTPLTSISGSLGLLQSGALGVLPDKAAAMVQIAHRNSGRLVRLINDILDIGKLEAHQLALQMVSVPLAELLQQSVEANASYADKYGVRFLLEAASGGDRVIIDPDRLMQVIANLLSNAAKFSPSGADVHIRLRPGPTAIRIEVEDSGSGISEAFRDRIFEKFAQADASTTRRFEGSGLGLSIARKLIEAMGGTIGFSTVVGQGTIFYLDLPRINDGSMAIEDQTLSESAAQ